MARRTTTLTGSQGFRSIGVVAGYVLKVGRLAASITQEQLAESFHVDVSTIQGWESGRRPLASTSAGELLNLGHFLARSGAPASIVGHLHEAVIADFIISTAIQFDGERVLLSGHPLANSVLRRSIANLVTWPFTGTLPQHLADFRRTSVGRGPVAKSPTLGSAAGTRFFDHLMAVSDRAAGDGEELLLRQATYLLGFDRRPSAKSWIGEFHGSLNLRNNDPLLDLHGHLASRSAAVALAASGEGENVHRFVESLSGQRAELVNLNYWAHWIGETSVDRVADEFMLDDLDEGWSGTRLFSHLVYRLRVDAVHRPLNLQSLHSLISCKPELLTRATVLRTVLADRLSEFESCSDLTRNERKQTVGLMYALRIAQA